jgi:hypothetical protein
MKNFLAYILLVVIGGTFLALTVRGVAGSPGPDEFKNNLDQRAKPFELSPERGRYAHVYSLAVDRHYDLSQAWAGAVYPDVGFSNGKFYSFFAPGMSYMAMPGFHVRDGRVVRHIEHAGPV